MVIDGPCGPAGPDAPVDQTLRQTISEQAEQIASLQAALDRLRAENAQLKAELEKAWICNCAND